MKIIEYRNIDESLYERVDFDTIPSVSNIIRDVKENGDSAIEKYCKEFDGSIKASEFLVNRDQIEYAYKQIDESVLKSLKLAIKNVRTFAKRQMNCLKKLNTKIYGCKLGHVLVPIEKVGCYIPGGNYPLPSSAIMTIVPAKVAKVPNVYAFSPRIKPVTIVAADLSGADKIYRIGGVQAIAAMAYGSESIESVNKIVGPGNRYVTAAKKQVYGQCGIDFLAGPSEVMIIADDKTANPQYVASDILAQCEHDLDAKAYLVCFSKSFANEVERIAIEMLDRLETSDIARKSFEKSIAIIVEDEKQAIEIANRRAPEHLELCIDEAKSKMFYFRNYGSLFIGNYSAEVFGDYCSGTNHTLPTNQVSKYSSGLNVFDYIKVQTYQMSSRLNARYLSKTASQIAQVEGLMAHRMSSELRK